MFNLETTICSVWRSDCMDVCHEGAKVSNELKCKALRAGRPVPVCLGEDLVYSISKKLLGGKIFFFFFKYISIFVSIYLFRLWQCFSLYWGCPKLLHLQVGKWWYSQEFITISLVQDHPIPDPYSSPLPTCPSIS